MTEFDCSATKLVLEYAFTLARSCALRALEDARRTVMIVGDDESDAASGRIGWSAPLARALIGAKAGDERIVRLPAGEKSYEVIAIRYPTAD